MILWPHVQLKDDMEHILNQPTLPLKSLYLTRNSDPQEKKRQRFSHPSRSAMWDDLEGLATFQGHNLLHNLHASLSESSVSVLSVRAASMSRIQKQKDLLFLLFGQQVEWSTLYWNFRPLVIYLLLKENQKKKYSVSMYLVSFRWWHVTQYTLFQFVLF